MESYNNSVFGKKNLIICAISVLLIIVGFWMMTGSANMMGEEFNNDIFSKRRIAVAPAICFSGFILMIVGIIFPSKKRK